MKDIKDYAKFYINSCECQVIAVDTTVKNVFAKEGEIIKFDEMCHYVVTSEDVMNVKLILRHLSDMTEEEAKEIGWWDEFENRIIYAKDFNQKWMFSSDQMIGLLSRGFDLFGLIEAGLAIDSTTLNTQKK